MKIKFASWNVNSRLLQTSHLKLIRKVDCDILALQEVIPKFYNALSGTDLFADSAFSLDLRMPDKIDSKVRRFGCALFGKAPFRISSRFQLVDLPFPRETLVGRFESPRCFITACSFHTPPGATHKELKPKSLRMLAEWLGFDKKQFILGIYANAPKIDHPDITKSEWWWQDETQLLRANPLHNLKDALRIYLDSHPDISQRSQKVSANEPLAVSYIRGNTDCRYDFILVTPDISVHSVEYLYKESIKAGSDHAIVVAELEVPE